MASTKTVANAVTAAQNEFKGITLSSTDSLNFANEIYQIIGTATFFDWRLTSGTTFGTTAGTQDYANVPSDFAALKADRCYIQDDSVSTNPLIPLDVRESLPKSTTQGLPTAIAQENANFRLLPVPNLTRSGSGPWAIKFEYWKRVPQLTSTSDDTFLFDDAEFSVFVAGLVARVAQFLDDDRAGIWAGRSAVTGGQFAGTGLWGRFAAMLNTMVANESMASGQQIYAPMESLFKG